MSDDAGAYRERQGRRDIIPSERVADFRGAGQATALAGRSLITRKFVRMQQEFS